MKPLGFFSRRKDQETKLKIPTLILLIYGATISLSVLPLEIKALHLLSSQYKGAIALTYFWLAISGIFAAFISWFLFTVAFYALSSLFKGKGDFRKIAEFVAWGFTPLMIGGVISCGIIFSLSSGIELPYSGTIQNGGALIREAFAANPLYRVCRLLPILFIIWSANLWVAGIKYARNLSTKKAAITVIIPVAIYIISTLHSGGFI
jgi:hypothetical protein